MKTQRTIGFVKIGLSTKMLLLFCLITYLGIHEYDGKWNLPILAWQVIGLMAGSPFIKILSGFIILCWLYLWVILLNERIVLNTGVVVVFASLYALAAFYAYDQIEVYSTLGHLHVNFLFYALPFALFTVSTALLFSQLKQ
jgi:hypothetical protein